MYYFPLRKFCWIFFLILLVVLATLILAAIFRFPLFPGKAIWFIVVEEKCPRILNNYSCIPSIINNYH